MGSIVDPSEVLLELGFFQPTPEQKALIVSSCIGPAEASIKRYLKYDPVYALRTEYYPGMDVTRTGREYIWEASSTQAFVRELSEMSSVELQVQHLPIRSVVVDDVQYPQVYIDYDGRFGTRPNSFNSDTLKEIGVDFWPKNDRVDSAGNPVCSDGILNSMGLWPAVAGCTKIVYYAGYQPKEFRGQDSSIDVTPIWEAAKDEAIRRFIKIMFRRPNAIGSFGPFSQETLGDYSTVRDPQTMQRWLGGGDLLPESIEKLSNYENWGWSLMS